MKNYLNGVIEREKAELKQLKERSDASQDLAEVRSIGQSMEAARGRLSEAEAQLRAMEQAQTEERGALNPVATYSQITQVETTVRSENMYASMEYRQAFQRYFQRGIPIPEDIQARVMSVVNVPSEVRAGDAINTGNTGAVIPVTVMREVINTIRKRYGNLYSKVTKLAVPGAVDFPIAELEANFSWITETTVSPEKEIGEVKTISFKYHTAEIRIAQTFLSAILSIEAFEAKIADVIAIAYAKAMDTGIIKGTGNGQMLGILNDARVTGLAGHTIALTAAEINNWTAWRKKFFAKLPLGYRDGEFIFSLGTVDFLRWIILFYGVGLSL